MEDTLRDIKKEVIMLYPLAVCRRVKLLNENFYEIYDHKSMKRIGKGTSKKKAWADADKLYSQNK